ncbi:MAG: DUF2240 family protein [Halodesulfurarchaeum sp.]
MSLRVTIAAPFKEHGRTTMREQAVVVDLAIDRNWLSPDQAKQLVEICVERGLLVRDPDGLTVDFDPDDVTIPDGFVPDESIFQQASPFEEILDTLESAGYDRRKTVASINSLQQELMVTADAACVLYARREGISVDGPATRILRSLRS